VSQVAQNVAQNGRGAAVVITKSANKYLIRQRYLAIPRKSVQLLQQYLPNSRLFD
jgi:hypothetical protein